MRVAVVAAALGDICFRLAVVAVAAGVVEALALLEIPETQEIAELAVALPRKTVSLLLADRVIQ
jgi:hypothetical protein